MKLPLFAAKLPHVSENRHLPARGVRKHAQRRLHRHRIGIVAVVHYRDAIFFDNVESAVKRLQLFDTAPDLLITHAKRPANCRCSQRVQHHVISGNGNRHSKAFCPVMNFALYSL